MTVGRRAYMKKSPGARVPGMASFAVWQYVRKSGGGDFVLGADWARYLPPCARDHEPTLNEPPLLLSRLLLHVLRLRGLCGFAKIN
jgi:hypothetical protein